ncbi:MAG: hypothetical protein ABI977_28105 [Acidobacteriota bacterium]
MSNKDAFTEREHWLEEDYFRRKNQELINRIHQQQALEAERQQMAEVIGVNDQDLLEALQDLGFHEDTVQLLHIVPLVQVAWAQDGIADIERERILKLAHIRGIEPGSKAYEQLNQWLTVEPSQAFFENTLQAIALLLATLPPDQREASRQDLIQYSTYIASSVGRRLLGLPEASKEEREIIKHIAEEIGRGREEKVRQVIGG